MDKSLILNEIKKYLNFKTDTEFAEYLGIKQNTISSWKARNSIDYDLIISKCDFIDANWLLTGRGDMLKKEQPEGAASADRSREIERLLELLDCKDQEITELKKELSGQNRHQITIAAEPELKKEK